MRINMPFMKWFIFINPPERCIGLYEYPLNKDIVDVAPTPIFTTLKGLDNWMLGGMKVLGRVFVLRRIAAAHMPTGLAKAQVYPAISHG
jgi:hypothetical protein